MEKLGSLGQSPRDEEAEGEKPHANSWEGRRRKKKGQHEETVTTVGSNKAKTVRSLKDHRK